MANQFTKQELVDFAKVGVKFEDNLVISGLAEKYQTDQTQMARANDTIWRVLPYIGVSYDGTDQTANFQENTQTAVPATIDQYKSAPFSLTTLDLRDQLQSERLQQAMADKLASDVNKSVLDAVCNQGSIFVKRSAAAAGYDDISLVDAIMNERGIPYRNRWLAMSSRDYNSAASNLQTATRSLDNEISSGALRDAYIGRVASIDTFKLDYPRQKAAALGGGGLTISTLYTAGGAGNYLLPQGYAAATTGQAQNFDNRKQQVTVSATTNVAAGDRFTVAGVNSCNMMTKDSTGQLQTFIVTKVISGTVLEISPPLINAAGTTQAEKAYGNVSLASQSATAAIVFQNTALGAINPFAMKGAIEILPGRIEVPANEGVASMRMTTQNGVELVVTKFFDGNVMKEKVRVDCFWGVCILRPEMAGAIMFSQP
jgi:hypothetical protein